MQKSSLLASWGQRNIFNGANMYDLFEFNLTHRAHVKFITLP
jgi:hypothetical protein